MERADHVATIVILLGIPGVLLLAQLLDFHFLSLVVCVEFLGAIARLDELLEEVLVKFAYFRAQRQHLKEELI